MVLFAHITSNVEGDTYQDLLNEKGGRGFPYLAILDAEGNVVAKPPSRSVEGFRTAVDAGGKFADLKAKKSPTAADKVELLILEIGLGNLTYDEAKTRAEEIQGLDDELKAKLAQGLLPLEVRSHIPPVRNPTVEQRAAAGKVFAEMFRAGRVPADEETVQPFFIFMLDHAEAVKDAELFRTALGKLTERFGDNPRAKGFFDAQQARLAKLEAEAADK
ncbi:MAG: hypothetical protein MUE73_11360 [Planctomycetes bacterium]|nr:hypothetical protein [Planctomycetota bacterium]